MNYDVFMLEVAASTTASLLWVQGCSFWVFWEGLSTTMSSSLKYMHCSTVLNTRKETSTSLWSSVFVQLCSLVCCPINSSHLSLSRFLALAPQLGGSPGVPNHATDWNLLQGRNLRPYLIPPSLRDHCLLLFNSSVFKTIILCIFSVVFVCGFTWLCRSHFFYSILAESGSPILYSFFKWTFCSILPQFGQFYYYCFK